MIALTVPTRSLRKTFGQIPGKTQSLPFLSLEELKPMGKFMFFEDCMKDQFL